VVTSRARAAAPGRRFGILTREAKLMKKFVAGLMVLALVALPGCKKDTGGTEGSKFSLTGPKAGLDLATTLKQGESTTITLTVKKDKNFKQNIALDAKPDGKGLDVDLGTKEVKDSDDSSVSVNLKITAAKDAPVGEQKVIVTGTPEKGDKAKVDLRVNVKKKG